MVCSICGYLIGALDGCWGHSDLNGELNGFIPPEEAPWEEIKYIYHGGNPYAGNPKKGRPWPGGYVAFWNCKEFFEKDLIRTDLIFSPTCVLTQQSPPPSWWTYLKDNEVFEKIYGFRLARE